MQKLFRAFFFPREIFLPFTNCSLDHVQWTVAMKSFVSFAWHPMHFRVTSGPLLKGPFPAYSA
jgi:hypothetical protein